CRKASGLMVTRALGTARLKVVGMCSGLLTHAGSCPGLPADTKAKWFGCELPLAILGTLTEELGHAAHFEHQEVIRRPRRPCARVVRSRRARESCIGRAQWRWEIFPAQDRRGRPRGGRWDHQDSRRREPRGLLPA